MLACENGESGERKTGNALRRCKTLLRLAKLAIGVPLKVGGWNA